MKKIQLVNEKSRLVAEPDNHIETCCKLYDVPEAVAKQWREDGDRRYQNAKTANYAILYGEQQ